MMFFSASFLNWNFSCLIFHFSMLNFFVFYHADTQNSLGTYFAKLIFLSTNNYAFNFRIRFSWNVAELWGLHVVGASESSKRECGRRARNEWSFHEDIELHSTLQSIQEPWNNRTSQRVCFTSIPVTTQCLNNIHTSCNVVSSYQSSASVTVFNRCIGFASHGNNTFLLKYRVSVKKCVHFN